MRRALPAFLFVMVGCYGSPPDLEGQPCGVDEPCPANYLCQSGGCVSDPGAPGPASSGTGGHTGTTGTPTTGTVSSHTTTSTGVGTATSAISNTAVTAVGTTGSNTGFTTTGRTTTGMTGVTTVSATATATSTTGTSGSLPICALCFQDSICQSGFCNLSNGGSEGFCDSFECGANPSVCNPFGCTSNGDCQCGIVSNTTAGSSGTSGSDECENCSQFGSCSAGGACYSFQDDGGGPDYCLDSCTSNAQCPPDAPCLTQYGVCLPPTGTCFGYTSNTGTSGTTGLGLPLCTPCFTGNQCATGYCDLGLGSPGFCDAVTNCFDNPAVCNPYGCSSDLTVNCACMFVTDTATGPTSSGTTGFTATATGLTATGTTGTGVAGTTLTSGTTITSGSLSNGGTFATATTFTTATAATAASGTTGGIAAASSSTGGMSCSGPGIQSDTDCGGANQVCASGEHCGSFTTLFGTSFLGCACTPANQGALDSCRVANDVPSGNGLVVCDSSTLSCRAPRDLELTFSAATNWGLYCDVGYGEHPIADGGSLCAQPCSTNSDCTADFTNCQPGAVYVWPTDGGNGNNQLFANYCGYNLCGPIPGLVDGGAFYGPCNSVGVGDGTCQPIAENGSYIGICMRNGNVPTTGACGGLLGQASTACASGDLCLPEGQPVDACAPQQTTYCLPACNANSPMAGPFTPACPNFFGFPTSCQTFSGDPGGNPLQAGICY